MIGKITKLVQWHTKRMLKPQYIFLRACNSWDIHSFPLWGMILSQIPNPVSSRKVRSLPSGMVLFGWFLLVEHSHFSVPLLYLWEHSIIILIILLIFVQSLFRRNNCLFSAELCGENKFLLYIPFNILNDIGNPGRFLSIKHVLVGTDWLYNLLGCA